MTKCDVDDEFAEAAAVFTAGNKIINDHFSHVHAPFWPGIEQCSNRRRNLVPDESGARFA